MADFAEKLLALMNERDLSQNALSKISGVPQKNISTYVLRQSTPSWTMVQKLAKALAVSCEALQDDDPPRVTSEPEAEPAPPAKKPMKGKK